ncbi:hypothetical protein [Fischerella thermalis]|uniref:hypothetical protein n=1 Tax=Fischerella thermalis TaxID=372787 RepID=UPI00031D421E|nr:hypothetical protein [Fischerella thermalis]
MTPHTPHTPHTPPLREALRVRQVTPRALCRGKSPPHWLTATRLHTPHTPTSPIPP